MEMLGNGIPARTICKHFSLFVIARTKLRTPDRIHFCTMQLQLNSDQGNGKQEKGWWQRVRNCSLPSPPGIALRLLKLRDNEGTGLGEASEAISLDPALAARILKIVNSAFYSLRHDVNTITHAVTLLGADRLYSVALSFSLFDGLRKFGSEDFDHASYWRRSVLAATAGRTLCPWAGESRQEEVFLASLLQDIGMLILNEAFPESYGEVIKQAGSDHNRLIPLEREHTGTDHTEIGIWVQEMWQLPKMFQVAVKGSHDPGDIDDLSPDLEPLVKAVALSGPFAEVWTSDDSQAACEKARVAAEQILGMDESAVQSVLEGMALGLAGVSNAFDVDFGHPEELQTKLDQATETLAA